MKKISYKYMFFVFMLFTGCSNSMFENNNPNTSSSSSVSAAKVYYGFGLDPLTYASQVAENNTVVMPVAAVSPGGVYYELATPGDIDEASLVAESFSCSGSCTISSVQVIEDATGVVTGYIVFLANSVEEQVTLSSPGVLDSSGASLDLEDVAVDFKSSAPFLEVIKTDSPTATIQLGAPAGYVFNDKSLYTCTNCVVTSLSRKEPYQVGIQVLDISQIATLQVNEGFFQSEVKTSSLESNIVTVDFRSSEVLAKVSIGSGTDYSSFEALTTPNGSVAVYPSPVKVLYAFSGALNKSLSVSDFTCVDCTVNALEKMTDRETYILEVSSIDSITPMKLSLSASDVKSYKSEDVFISFPKSEGRTQALNSILSITNASSEGEPRK